MKMEAYINSPAKHITVNIVCMFLIITIVCFIVYTMYVGLYVVVCQSLCNMNPKHIGFVYS